MAGFDNHTSLAGNLAADAEHKNIGSSDLVEFSLAVNRRFRKNGETKEEVHYFDVKLWGNRGKNLVQHLTKGKRVGVLGPLCQDRFETREGQKREKVYVEADDVALLG